MSFAITVLGLTGCFHPEPLSPERSVAKWRATQTPKVDEHGSPQAVTELGPEETYLLAVDNSAALAALDARAEVADARVKEARQLDNPQLRIADIDVEDIRDGQAWFDAVVRVPIPRPGSLQTRAEAAKLVAQSERTLSADAKRVLRARIHKRFALLAMLQADREQATAVRELAEQRRAFAKERLDAEAGTKLDVALADVEVAEAVAEEQGIEGEIEQLEGDLQRLAGVDGPVRFRVEGSPAVRDADLDHEVLVEKAVRSRPELRAAQAGVGVARAQVHLARNKTWPWFEWGQVDYHAGPNATGASWGFGVALTLPVLSWNRGEIRATKAQVRQREAEESQEIAAIADEVREAAGRVEWSAKRVHQLQTVLLPPIEAAATEATAAVESGSLDRLAANEIALKAVEARRRLIAAELEHRVALIELEAAVGAPIGAGS
jgi:outer membrane protein TolC